MSYIQKLVEMKSVIYTCLICFVLFNTSCQERNKKIELSEDEQLIEVQDKALTLSLLTDTITLENHLIQGYLENNTSLEFTFGESYKLEYWNDSIWSKVIYPEDLVIHSIAYGLPAYGKANFKIKLDLDKLNLKQGKYRLTKKVSTRFEVQFNVVDSIDFSDRNGFDNKGEEEELNLVLSSDLFKVGVDSIPFTITNNLYIDVFPLEFYMLQYYDESFSSWLDFYYRSYTPKEGDCLHSGQSMEYVIYLNTKKYYRYGNRKDLYQDKYFLRPGLYRLYKDIQTYLSNEFYLSM